MLLLIVNNYYLLLFENFLTLYKKYRYRHNDGYKQIFIFHTDNNS